MMMTRITQHCHLPHDIGLQDGEDLGVTCLGSGLRAGTEGVVYQSPGLGKDTGNPNGRGMPSAWCSVYPV